jgi:phosphoribosylformylglycinamidine synthase I
MAFGIIQFPGSNCDYDCYNVAKNILDQESYFIWHAQAELPAVFGENPERHVIVLPGGFSYGDYLRCGAIAHLAPVMQAVKNFAKAGGRVLGICNGFQILVESGLLPGVLQRNSGLKFICEDVVLKITNPNTPFTSKYGEAGIKQITVPIAHGEGNYYCSEEELKKLKANNQIVFEYANNPNGSLANIAGICNETFNVLGLMPHPERCAEALLGNRDGLMLFESLLSAVKVPA